MQGRLRIHRWVKLIMLGLLLIPGCGTAVAYAAADNAREGDEKATAQLLNDKVESWVREYPGQWQWFHDRWGNRKKFLEKSR